MAYIKIDDKGRITAASRTHHCGDGEIETAIPEEIGFDTIHDYRFAGGEFIFDPAPVQDGGPPAQETRIAALETAVAALLTGMDSE